MLALQLQQRHFVFVATVEQHDCGLGLTSFTSELDYLPSCCNVVHIMR